MNIGELRQLTAHLDDNVAIVVKDIDGYLIQTSNGGIEEHETLGEIVVLDLTDLAPTVEVTSEM